MGVEVGFWKIVGETTQPVEYQSIDAEKRLEKLVVSNLSIICNDKMVIGQQVRTVHGKIIDLLAMDANGKLTIIELKRNKTPREVVAQTLDYASWVATLKADTIKDIFREFCGKVLEEEFGKRFGTALPETVNQEHDMLIVCSSLDPESERIVGYMSQRYNVPINVVFLRYFKDEKSEYLSRSWMIDPALVEEKSVHSSSSLSSEQWNGKDWVVNVDRIADVSVWEDAMKYGFICAGGGSWYSATLKPLKPGYRVFAMIPKKGYVGVGEVTTERTPMAKFTVEYNGEQKPVGEVPLACSALKDYLVKDEEKSGYFVGIRWIKTVKESEAFWKAGMRANQNSAFRLKDTYTLNHLIEFFKLEE